VAGLRIAVYFRDRPLGVPVDLAGAAKNQDADEHHLKARPDRPRADLSVASDVRAPGFASLGEWPVGVLVAGRSGHVAALSTQLARASGCTHRPTWRLRRSLSGEELVPDVTLAIRHEIGQSAWISRRS